MGHMPIPKGGEGRGEQPEAGAYLGYLHGFWYCGEHKKWAERRHLAHGCRDHRA